MGAFRASFALLSLAVVVRKCGMIKRQLWFSFVVRTILVTSGVNFRTGLDLILAGSGSNRGVLVSV